jgi:NAD-dependent deacetylase
MRSSQDPDLVFEMEGTELVLGDLCPLGSQLRPHIVWFGEGVPLMANAVEHARNADFFIVVGTSMVVYPAAGLLNYAPETAQKFVVDVKKPELEAKFRNLEFIENKASIGLSELAERLIKAERKV